MTKPAKYQELVEEGKLPVNCNPDGGHPLKLIGSLDEQGNVYLYCSQCHKDRKLSYSRIKAVHDEWERKQMRDNPMQLMQEMSAWMDAVLPSYDGGNASYSMDIEEQRMLLQARVKVLLNGIA